MVPTLLGALSFVVFALVLEVILSSLLLNTPSIKSFITASPWIYAAYVGLMAGIFEETGRLCIFLLIKRRSNSLNTALAYGIGHGGIEAILLVGLTMLVNMICAIAFNINNIDLVPSVNPAQTIDLLLSMPSSMFLIAGIERLVAISFHIAASVLVWMAACKRGPWGLYFLAIFFHMAMNFPAGLYQFGTLQNIWIVESITAGVALCICIATVFIYRKCAQSYTPLLNYDISDL